MQYTLALLGLAALTTLTLDSRTASAELKPAHVTGEGWRELTLADFENVNGTAETWTERDGMIICSGKPNGGARMRTELTNFEMVCEWRHLEYAGNAGIFIWCPESAFTDLPPGSLPVSYTHLTLPTICSV